MSKNYYLTTTSPYVNSDPHVGFALEIIQADVLARFHKLLGDEVFFNTGTDEHGKKIYEKAIESRMEPQAYCDMYAAKFGDLKKALNLSYNSFWRSTEPKHIEAAQEMWRRVDKAGYIEKGIYHAKYCVGCELEKQDSDLVDGKCPLHPNKVIENIAEENYFFKFSKLSKKLLEHYDKYPDFVVPAHRQKEIRNFVESELTDFSISRLTEKMPWGVPVPNDPKHCMYVWFDALTYYISSLGWPDDEKKFAEFWGTTESPNAVQVCGKDNLRQQTAMWQAMLIAAGLPPTRQVHVHGFINSGGQKMSKSLGNVVNPIEYSDKYGTDGLRYYLLAKVAPAEDSDFTREKFEDAYKADLQNGLGNLVSRVAAMATGGEYPPSDKVTISDTVSRALNEYKFDSAMASIWDRIKKADQFISENQVWKLTGEEKSSALTKMITEIRQIAVDLQPFLPETADKIIKQYNQGKIVKNDPMYPRLT
jgi:methionyl-tRNA synthetase